jgi:uncharacterized phage-associated protein
MFDEAKTTQIAARFIYREGGTIPHLKLMKLLYIADREALINWGYPLTFDNYLSMKHGPVLSNTLELINDGSADPSHSAWEQVISAKANHKVSLMDSNKMPNSELLSVAEQALIDQISERFAQKDQWQMVKYTHQQFKEWQDPAGTCLPINFEDIFCADGISQTEAKEMANNIRLFQREQTAFANL